MLILILIETGFTMSYDVVLIRSLFVDFCSFRIRRFFTHRVLTLDLLQVMTDEAFYREKV